MATPSLPLTDVAFDALAEEDALTLHLVICPLAVKQSSIRLHHHSFTMPHVLEPETFIVRSVAVRLLAEAVLHISLPLALIRATVWIL